MSCPFTVDAAFCALNSRSRFLFLAVPIDQICTLPNERAISLTCSTYIVCHAVRFKAGIRLDPF